MISAFSSVSITNPSTFPHRSSPPRLLTLVLPALPRLIATYGVGETSTFNPICGMQAERIPCLHLVGLPSTLALGEGRLLHHTLGDGRMRVFERMMREVAGVKEGCEVIGMGREEEGRGGWGEVVDRVIRVALNEVGRLPGGRGLWGSRVRCSSPLFPRFDSVDRFISVYRKIWSPGKYPASRFTLAWYVPRISFHNHARLTLHHLQQREPSPEPTHTSITTKTDQLVRSILDRVAKSSNPVLVGDFYAQRFGLGQGLRRLCEGLGVRFFGSECRVGWVLPRDEGVMGG